MNELNAKKLCLQLADSENEEEVLNLLKKVGFWDNDAAWENYGQNENNFSIVGNQQSSPDSALVEKLINSVDAMLIKECRARGIDPESKDAPQSLTEGVNVFFDVKNGILTEISASRRSELGENIKLVASGSKRNPCYSIIDFGEGQIPERFPDTFVSLQKSNKLRIPFVQGKFNMGGTGVLQFCGNHNLQLIISKRHPDLVKREKNSSNKWGFTIVRRKDPIGKMRSSVYQYLAPGGNVLSFEADSLPLLPGKYPAPRGEAMGYGSFIKLYNYSMPGLKTNIILDLYNRLSFLLPNIALPVRLYERRKGYGAHSYETTLAGLSVRLEDDKRDNIEDGFPSSSTIKVAGQTMKSQIFAFKKGRSKKYVRNEGVVLVQNGQTQGSLARSFFSRRSVGMNYLADSILVLVECRGLTGRSKEDLFVNSRDRLRDVPLKEKIEKEIEGIIKNHAGLRELKNKRRMDEIQNKLDDSKPLKDVLNSIIKKSPALASLLLSGKKLHDPFNLIGKSEMKEFKGREFPTYFKLKGMNNGDTKNCHIKSRYRINFETDAENDYFERDVAPGEFTLLVNGDPVKEYVINLWNGIATLNVSLPQKAVIHDKLDYSFKVTDRSNINPYEGNYKVIVIPELKPTGGGKGPRRDSPGKKDGKEREAPSALSLPQIIDVHKDGWEKEGFDKFSSLKIKDAGEDGGYDFYVNVDNIHLLSEIKSNAKLEPKLLIAKYRYALVLIGLSLLKTNEEKKKEIFGLDNIRKFCDSVSPLLLPMISYLGELEIDEIEKNSGAKQ